MDQYLHEQHTTTLTRNHQVSREFTDESQRHSWVMLRDNGSIQPLPNERILHQVPGKVRCDITSKEFTNKPDSFSLANSNGRAYVTNQRVGSIIPPFSFRDD
jgi:hypothetical protein